MGWPQLILPGLVAAVGILLLFGGDRASGAFFAGAAEGLRSAAALFPTLLMFVCAASMFRASGAMEMLCSVLSPLCEMLQIDGALVPLLLMRPLSGGASMAMLSDLFSVYGPDSPIGLCASVLCGASETTFYVLAVYVGTRRLRYRRQILLCSVLAAVFVSVLSVLLGRQMLCAV